MKYIIFLFFLTGCASLPSSYYQYVKIVNGPYSGRYGQIVGDCSGFENYKVKLSNKHVCVRIWNLEKVL